jgi:hypothetical protein
MPGTARPRSSGCRSRRRATLGLSNLPRFAGCSRSPAPHSETGVAGAPVGRPQTNQEWGAATHLYHTGGRPWSSCARRRGRWAQLPCTYRGKWCDCGVVMFRRRRQQPSRARYPKAAVHRPPQVAAPRHLDASSWRERGRVLAAEMPMTLRGLPRLRLTKLSGAVLHNRGALMFPAGTFEEWPR